MQARPFATRTSVASCTLAVLFSALIGTAVYAQVPDGHYVFGAFSPSRGDVGIFTAHPRTPGTPTAIANMQGDLRTSGASCILYRRSDGAILAGERAPVGASVDLHVIWLNGSSVLYDASISVGTGGSCCGEIPQMAMLSDDRVVVAVTDVSAGPLKNILTTSYGWQGLGIVDTTSGLVTSIPITNGTQIVDVFNGLALSPDETTVYAATYVSSTVGDIWAVPIKGGAATKLATVGGGISNLTVDANGDVWVTTLNSVKAFYKVDAKTGTATAVTQLNGSLNALVYDEVTGNFAVLSANSGMPARSLFWMEPNGTDHLLSSPNFAILSGIDINPSPEIVGFETPATASYAWVLPNPDELPLVGNQNFGLTISATGISRPGWSFFCLDRAKTPFQLLGVDVFVDLTTYFAQVALPLAPVNRIPLPLPNDSNLVGARILLQNFYVGDSVKPFGASPAIEFSVL
ncbi:MAG: hypothetical protein KDC95_10635 [Planctomycetes bacterium]|nr:hypothetical protein [Planctomycetota bacterium]